MQLCTLDSSSDYVSNSASIQRLAASASTSEFAREETTLQEEPENEMNIASNSPTLEKQSPITKEDEQVIFGESALYKFELIGPHAS